MILHRCDIKECGALSQYGCRTVQIAFNSYDLCQSCYDKFMLWIGEHLNGGSPVNNFKLTVGGISGQAGGSSSGFGLLLQDGSTILCDNTDQTAPAVPHYSTLKNLEGTSDVVTGP